MESVSQSIGRPISVATKNGLRSALGDPSGPSVVIVTARRPGDLRAASPGLAVFASVVFGVGHTFAVPASVSPCPCPCEGAGLPPDFRMSIVVGVGPDPDAFPSVRGANGCRAEQTPLRIEPELGKVMEDVGEPESNKRGDVLQQDESGSQVSDDGYDGWPEPALIVSSTLLPGRAERLARETGSDEIHSATPRSSVERGEVIPDRSRIQTRLRHPLHENGRCVGVPLNVSHGSYPPHGSEGELESSVAGAEVDGR